MNCTAENCENPTDVYLCRDCVTELDTAMAKIPDLLPVLAMITRKEEQPFTVRANRGGGKPGPTTPLNLQAHALWETLSMATTLTPDQYAGDPEGAYAKTRIEDAVNRADIMVNGESENTMTDDYIIYRAEMIEPMPSRLMAEYLQEKLGLNITDSRIRKWASRGELPRANNDAKNPVYRAEDVIARHTGKPTLKSIRESTKV
jgi:hypothetical protein